MSMHATLLLLVAGCLIQPPLAPTRPTRPVPQPAPRVSAPLPLRDVAATANAEWRTTPGACSSAHLGQLPHPPPLRDAASIASAAWRTTPAAVSGAHLVQSPNVFRGVTSDGDILVKPARLTRDEEVEVRRSAYLARPT